jgi:hypothetical protein
MVPLVRAPRSSTHIQAIAGTTRVRETMAAAETVVAETAAVTDPLQSLWANRPNMKLHVAGAVSPNKSLQRSVNHKVLGRGRVVSAPDGRRRARLLTSQPAAAELSR